MEKRVGIVGIGTSGFRATTPDVSYRELTYEAATKAYLDAGIGPDDVGSFVATSEDFLEGYSIADEYSPDQLGGVLKSVHTVPGGDTVAQPEQEHVARSPGLGERLPRNRRPGRSLANRQREPEMAVSQRRGDQQNADTQQHE